MHSFSCLWLFRGLRYTAPGNVCTWIFCGQEIEILLSHSHLAMGRHNIGILQILGVKSFQLPVTDLLQLSVSEAHNTSEDRHLLDEFLKTFGMYREG